jgi:hypothetical protein
MASNIGDNLLMRFNAVSIGGAVPRTNFDCAVQSSFPSAANLHLAQDGVIITLLASGDSDLPQGIRLQTPAVVTLTALRAGERASCRAGVLRFETFPLTVDLRQARLWVCDLPSLDADLSRPDAACAWETIWEALARRQTASKAEIVAGELFSTDKHHLIGQRVGQYIQKIILATRQLDTRGTFDSCKKLIGLGQGLTPSGDDLLVGYLAGLWSAVRDREERRAFLRELGEALRSVATQTNGLSRTYLVLAADGQVSSGITGLIEAICRGWETDRLLDAAEKVMRIGHTSGMDTVTGLLVGLGAWDGEIFDHKGAVNNGNSPTDDP